MGVMFRRGSCAVGLLALVAIVTPASAVTQNGCLGRKLGDVGRTTAAALACHARDAAKPSMAALTSCLDKLDLRFTGGDDPSRSLFAKRERKPPCPTVGDQETVGRDLFAFADALDHAVGNLVSRCDSAELACFGKYVAAAFGCLARAANGTGVIDPVCLARAADKLGDETAGCLGKAALRADCSPGADAETLRSETEAFVAATLCDLDPNGTSECGTLPTPVPTPSRTPTPIATRTPTPVPTGGSHDASRLCVDIINGYRASIGRPPLARWTEKEACAEDQGFADAESGRPHSAFGQCTEWAQNECPNWPGPPEQMIDDCLAMMWAEGPGEPYSEHGHYINMANPGYTKVACGFAVLSNGRVWAIQNFR
jgi:hypothetical protein